MRRHGEGVSGGPRGSRGDRRGWRGAGRSVAVPAAGIALLLTGVAGPSGPAPAAAAPDACATETPSTDAEGRYVIDTPGRLAWISGVDLDADRDRTVDDAASDAVLAARMGHDYVQTAVVDLAGCEWLPIGLMRTSDNAAMPHFDGTYDGGGYEIRGLTITARTGILTGQRDFLGLFARTGQGGVVIRDVTIVDAAISAASSELRFTGILIGQTSTPLTVEDVTVSGTIEDVSVETGGLIGDLGDFLNDGSDGDVLIARVSADVTITPGPFSSDGSRVGGLVGEVNPRSTSTRIVDSTVTGSVTAGSGSSSTGGLVGMAYDFGGFLSVERSSAAVAVTGRGAVGGLIGEGRSVVVRDASATGAVTGSGYSVGGLLGALGGPAIIERSFSTGAVSTSEEQAGGLVGATFDLSGTPTIRYVYATGTVTEGSDDWIPSAGGLVGYFGGGSISDAFTTSTISTADGVTAGYAGAAGGAVGRVPDDATGATVRRVLARSTVGSTAAVGGLGALLGLVPDADVAEASFYDTGLNGAMPGIGSDSAGAGRNAAGVTGRSAAELTAFATYADAGWPIVDGWVPFDADAGQVWGICSGLEDGFPFLLWQYDSVGASSCGGGRGGGGDDGTERGPVPIGVPSGEGPGIPGRLAVAGMLAAAGVVAALRRGQGVTG